MSTGSLHGPRGLRSPVLPVRMRSRLSNTKLANADTGRQLLIMHAAVHDQVSLQLPVLGQCQPERVAKRQ